MYAINSDRDKQASWRETLTPAREVILSKDATNSTGQIKPVMATIYSSDRPP